MKSIGTDLSDRIQQITHSLGLHVVLWCFNGSICTTD